jgi:hypothetical protein
MPTADLKPLRLYAERDDHGHLHTRYLLARDGGLHLATAHDEGERSAAELGPRLQIVGPVSYLSLRVTFARYGRPLAPEVDLAQHRVNERDDDQPLTVRDEHGETATLCRFRYKPYGWVYPADYLLWSPALGEALAAEAPLITAALSALARAAARRG